MSAPGSPMSVDGPRPNSWKAATKRLLGARRVAALSSYVSQFRSLGLGDFTRFHRLALEASVREVISRRHYIVLDEEQLRATRKSDRVFIFGSGASLNELSQREWESFGLADVIGFNLFFLQEWVDVDYHLFRSGLYTLHRRAAYRYARAAAATLTSNPRFKQAIIVLQGEYPSVFCDHLVGFGFLTPGSRVFRYKTARIGRGPSHRLNEGLYHEGGTLCDAVNFAYCLGWNEIVLVGVDLYDSRYFYVRPDSTVGFDQHAGEWIPSERNTFRGQRYDEPHNTVKLGILDTMARWSQVLRSGGVELSVYNRRSLLAGVLPVYGNDRSVTVPEEGER